jgi:hypothetical protein
MMEKSRIGLCSALIALMVMLNAAMVWGQSKDATIADWPLREERIADSKDMSTDCSTFARSEYRYGSDINEQRPSTNGVMVAEDMRCRQCRGKCKAEDLRCRSQCAGESGCLAHCEERSSQCEAMCRQIFRCE